LTGSGEKQRGCSYALTHALAKFGKSSLLLAYHPSVEVVVADALISGVLLGCGSLRRHSAYITICTSKIVKLLF
jgi:uncharacterized membrane protein YgdD (TMEM256/DUF423 family)